MTPVPCFMVEETGRARYSASIIAKGNERCPARDGAFHRVEVNSEWLHRTEEADFSLAPTLDFPATCACGLVLTKDNAFWSAGYAPEWRRVDTDETADTPRAFGPGAMYFIRGKHACFPHDPPCAEHLHVILPNGSEWDIDSRANNCTRPDDKTHRCWVREGVPPNVTAGKGGDTCAAGAGSILSGDYHGFLRGGALVSV